MEKRLILPSLKMHRKKILFSRLDFVHSDNIYSDISDKINNFTFIKFYFQVWKKIEVYIPNCLRTLICIMRLWSTTCLSIWRALFLRISLKC